MIGAQLSIKDKFLLWTQQIKEAIIIKNFQRGQFHVINHARNLVGAKWGLDRDPLNLADRHRDSCGAEATKEQYDQALTASYTPAHLVEEIYPRLVYDGDVKGAMDFLKDDPEVQESIVMNESVFFETIKDPLGQDISLVTRKGVAKIASMVGLITPPQAAKKGFFARLFSS